MVRRGEFEGALKFAEKKITNLQDGQIGRVKLQNYFLTLGKIHFILGDYRQAEKDYKTGLVYVNTKLEAHKRLKLRDFNVLDELALFYVNTGNFQQGREFINRSLKLRIRKFDKNNPANFRPYLPLGMLFFYQGQFDSARYYLKTYQKQIRNSNYTGFLDIDRYADTFQVLSELEIKTDHLNNARKFARKSARLQRHQWTKRESGKNYIDRVHAVNTLSKIYRLAGKYKRAGMYNRKALSLYRRKYDRDNYAMIPVYINKAWLELADNHIDTVKRYLNKAIALQLDFITNNFNYLSVYEKENYYGRLREGFNEMNTLLLKMYFDKKISMDDPFWSVVLNYNIRTKAIILSETNRIVENIRQSNDTTLIEMFSRWTRLKNEWAYRSNSSKRTNEVLKSLRNDIVEIEKEMNRRALHLNEADQHQIEWTDIKAQLGAQEAAVELIRVDAGSISRDSAVMYIGFVMKNNVANPEIVIFANGDQLEKRYIKNYFNSIYHDVTDTLSFAVFWKPLTALLTGMNSIYISADGVFNLLNICALKDPGTNHFLIDNLNIINVTNTRHIISKSSDQFTFTSACLFGSPDFSSYSKDERAGIGFEDIPVLPGTEKEVIEIDDLLKSVGVTTQFFIHDKASEQRIKQLPSVHVLHVATHGFFISTSFGIDPMLGSGLIFSKQQGTQTDGILTAYEASTLNLDDTELVVLSACKTGLGEIKEGEGVYGLQRAFEVAGVNNIIMTLWNVDDAVTKEFMVDFYQRLVIEKNVASAFQHTQLQLKKKYSNPFYWAPFKLIKSF